MTGGGNVSPTESAGIGRRPDGFDDVAEGFRRAWIYVIDCPKDEHVKARALALAYALFGPDLFCRSNGAVACRSYAELCAVRRMSERVFRGHLKTYADLGLPCFGRVPDAPVLTSEDFDLPQGGRIENPQISDE